MLMIPDKDTSLDEAKSIEMPYERLMYAIENKLVFDRKYFNVAFLQDVNPGADGMRDQRCDLPQLGVAEEEGIIIDTFAEFRGIVGRHMGMEISVEQAEALEQSDDNIFIPRFYVYDVRVTGAVITDGPSEREELLASFENEMKNRKNEKTQQMLMAESLAKLVDFMATKETGIPTDGILTPEQIMDAMTPAQLREMADSMETPPDKPKRIVKGK